MAGIRVHAKDLSSRSEGKAFKRPVASILNSSAVRRMSVSAVRNLLRVLPVKAVEVVQAITRRIQVSLERLPSRSNGNQARIRRAWSCPRNWMVCARTGIRIPYGRGSVGGVSSILLLIDRDIIFLIEMDFRSSLRTISLKDYLEILTSMESYSLAGDTTLYSTALLSREVNASCMMYWLHAEGSSMSVCRSLDEVTAEGIGMLSSILSSTRRRFAGES